MEKIYNLAFELKNLMNENPDLVKLNELNEKLNNSEEVMRLAYIKDRKVDELEDLMRFFNEESEEIKSAKKALYDAKLALDSNPLVREYLEVFSKVRDLELNINEKLFSLLDESMCPNG